MKREFALSTPLQQVSRSLNDDADLGLEVESLSNGTYRIYRDEPVGFFKHGMYSLSCAVSAISDGETRIQLKGKVNIAVILVAIAGTMPLLYRTIKDGWQDPLMVGFLLATPVVMWLIYRFHINSLLKKVGAFFENE